MKKFTKIATVAVMTMVTAGVFAGCGLKGGKDIGKEAFITPKYPFSTVVPTPISI